MLLFNFNNYYFWEDFPMKVTFDGPNKLILINEGETSINFREDIFSNWKEWVQQPVVHNDKFDQALEGIGGQPTVVGRALGTTYFLKNDWKIRTWEGDHRLQIDGNFFSDDGSSPTIPTIGNFTVTYEFTVSDIVETIFIEATANAALLANTVWEAQTSEHTTSGSFGEIVQSGNVVATVDEAAIATAVWDRDRANNLASGSFGESLQNVVSSVEGSADAVWDEALSGHLTVGTTGEKLSQSASVNTDAIADAVLDEAIADHLIVGSMGAKLDDLANAETTANLVWDTTLAQHVTSGTTGEKLDLLANTNVEFIVDSVWDETVLDHLSAGSTGNAIAEIQSNTTDIIATVNANAIASAVWDEEVVNDHTTANTAGSVLAIIQKILRNKTVTDPDTGIMTVYADDGITVLFTAPVYEDINQTQPYRGEGIEVRNRLE